MQLMLSNPIKLPVGIRLIERGWLSANTVLLFDENCATTPASAIDTGYYSHSTQTVQLIDAALQGRALARIINTHLHSDHCGGNAALAAHFGCDILIPPGQARAVANWDTQALSYDATGQDCPRFTHTGLVQPNDELHMGGARWQALAAPGHDPDSLIFYCSQHALLISADALWENGFGVVFPELEGVNAFDAVAATLDRIEALPVRMVLPGHGAAFSDVRAALKRARSRLNSFAQDPIKHRWYAVKVLCMFWMMAQASLHKTTSREQAIAHLSNTRYIATVASALGGSAAQVVQQALDEMVTKGQLRLENAHSLHSQYAVV